MTKIFISHSSSDKVFALELAHALRQRDIDTWTMEEDIPTGKKWSAAIQEGLNHCDVMIVIITPLAMESVNVEDEWQNFLDRDKQVFPVRWLPVPVEKMPFQLNRLQYVDFHARKFGAAFKELCEELKQSSIEIDDSKTQLHLVQAPALPIRVKILGIVIVVLVITFVLALSANLLNGAHIEQPYVISTFNPVISTPQNIVESGDIFAIVPAIDQGSSGSWAFARQLPSFSSRTAKYYRTQDMPAAVQVYEHGFMLWREDNGDIYVFFDNGAVQYFSRPAIDSMPANFVSNTPPDGLVRPTGGFGAIWGSQSDVRERLGWALDVEVSYVTSIRAATRGNQVIITLPLGWTVSLNSAEDTLTILENSLQQNNN